LKADRLLIWIKKDIQIKGNIHKLIEIIKDTYKIHLIDIALNFKA